MTRYLVHVLYLNKDYLIYYFHKIVINSILENELWYTPRRLFKILNNSILKVQLNHRFH